ncbi:hypothetical protein [Starkeya nomas]|uniref:hypothetical protein n=1 Tax=Starkeya nomas TaxID=2666134 RepID=UPI0013585C75|nr:hypothetical protein [Starkeya nomas]
MSTYVRPPEAPRSNDLLDVAAALQSFSPVLTQAFENMEAKQAASAEAAVAQSTVEELQAHVRAGTSPISSSPFAAKAFAKSAATQLATRRVQALQTAWDSGEFDRDTGDFDAFIAGAAAEDLKGIQDTDAKEIYGAVLNKFSPRLRAQATEYKVKREKDTALTAVGDTWFAAVTLGISEGKSPAELQAALRGQYGYYKDTMGLQPQELDGVVLNVSRRLAENPNNEKYVEHFLSDTRGGIGSIAAKQDAGPTAQVILNRAQSTTAAYQKEQLRLQNKAAADADQARVQSSLEVAAENGTLAFMTPVDVRTEAGDTKTVTADDQQKQGVELIRKKAESMAAQGNPEGGMNYRIGALSKNGLVDPQFTRFTDTANPEAVPASLKPNLTKVREKLGDLQQGSWEFLSPSTWPLPGRSGNGVGAITMTDDVARKLEQWGEFYVRLGKSPDDAVELAKERIQAGHTIVNGNPVPTTDRAVPENFRAIAEHKLKQWADTYGVRYGYEAGDLTVEPAGDGQQGVWTIIRAHGDGPVLVEEEDARGGLNFSLRAAKVEQEAAAKAAVVEAQNAKQQRRNAPANAGRVRRNGPQ